MVLAATAGSSRHALVADEHLRSLFAYMRAMTVPTSLYAGPEDWGAPEIVERIRRAATELTVLVDGGVEEKIAEQSWSGYQHQFAGNAARAERAAEDVNFDSHLMRLAAGGESSTDANHASRPEANPRITEIQ